MVIHFNPIDKYPPAVNWLRYLAGKSNADTILTVVTMAPERTNWDFKIPGVVIKRVVTLYAGLSRIRRAFKYFVFNFKALYTLLVVYPDTIMYYETLSAFAPYIYIKWINRSCKLLIHYHEYTSPVELQNGMLLSRWFHKLECKLYQQAIWISHTNKDRLKMFLNDIKPQAPTNTFVLPNYPPKAWREYLTLDEGSKQVRIGFVYVGALSLDTMYTKEMAEFVAANEDNFYWDIYSENHQKEALDFLQSLNTNNIQFKGAVKYDDLPVILPKYNIGVVLYKGHIPNYIYNAPNKLFEYFACGLSVWFPNKMKGAFPYICRNKNQAILPVDFENLHISSINDFKNLKAEYLPCAEYFCEDVLEPLWNKIKT